MTTGPVSAAVIARVAHQLAQDRIVVWYDPERVYEGLAVPENFPGVPVVTFNGSFLRLRHLIEPALAGQEPKPALLYVPLSREACQHALIEAESAGVVMRPGEQPPARNTRLAVVARAVLAGKMGGPELEEVIRRIDRGQLTLADLDAMEPGGARSAVLGLIFASHDPMAIALRFLSDPTVDEALETRQGWGELAAVLAAQFGVDPSPPESPAALRKTLARNVLLSELAEALHGDLPRRLAGAAIPGAPAVRARCATLARAWRNDRRGVAAYMAAAQEIDDIFAIEWSGVPLAGLAGLETLKSIEGALLGRVLAADLDGDVRELLQLAERRSGGFWAEVASEVLDQWTLVTAILRLLDAARGVAREVERAPADLPALAARYLEGSAAAEPWCHLDTLFRHMERRVRASDLLLTAESERLQILVAEARRLYRRAVGALTGRFVPLLGRAGFTVPGVARQREVFDRWVAPALEHGRTAYVLVDGLRFEMARELFSALTSATRGELAGCVAQVPTITKLGMAALQPFAHHDMALQPARGGKVAVLIGGQEVSSRAARLAFLERSLGMQVPAFHLGDLLPPKPKARSALREARLVVVTVTDELDGLAEQSNPAMAHRLMDDALYQLDRLVRLLLAQGIATVVVTSDHGFLLGAELGEVDPMPPPGGETLELHPRVWIGRGGGQAPGLVRTTTAGLGLGGDVELAFPSTLACFSTAAGAGAYHHGGLTPQEVFVPVLTFRPRGVPATRTDVEWELSLGSRTVSSPFVTVSVQGRATGLFPMEAMRVRVEVREGRQSISRPVSAAYGFDEATGSVGMEVAEDGRTLRRNSILVRLDPLPKGSHVEVVLVESDSGAVVASVKQVSVTLAGF